MESGPALVFVALAFLMTVACSKLRNENLLVHRRVNRVFFLLPLTALLLVWLFAC